MDNILRFFRHYGLSICVALTILYLCMMPGNDSNFDIKIPNMDKYVHAVMYFVLSFTISLNLYQEYTKYKSMTMVMWAVVIPILFGGLIRCNRRYFGVPFRIVVRAPPFQTERELTFLPFSTKK